MTTFRTNMQAAAAMKTQAQSREDVCPNNLAAADEIYHPCPTRIFCTLHHPITTTCRQTEYQVIDASHGFAQVKKRNPNWLEAGDTFDVPVGQIAVVWTEDEFGRVIIEHEPEQVERRELAYPHLM